ncbi:MAG: aromatic ring-hydroxylating dioxygenase subunit alpha [Pseudomonadota bacterium]
MNNALEEKHIIETVLGYTEQGTTHMQPAMLNNPVSHYTDIDRLQLEIDTLFRKFPIIVGHASQAQTSGEYFTHDVSGMPLLITRTQNHEIKAFINVCRHRGAQVVNQPCGKAKTFACPYHRWVYDLDGRLRGTRQPEGFVGLDKSQHGLVELPAFERFGLIWVRPTPSATPVDIDAWLQPMAGQLASIDLAEHQVYKTWTLHKDMSWRVALEGFQESYHFCAAHETTACSTYLDNQSVFLNQYPHVRHAVPLAQIVALKEQAEDQWDYRANFMTQNFLFPCNFVQVMTDHVYIHTIAPTGPGKCVFNCLMLVPQDHPKGDRYWEANYNVVRNVFDEDFAIGEGIQRGLATGVNQHFVFGRYESGLHLAQKAMDDALAGRLTA